MGSVGSRRSRPRAYGGEAVRARLWGTGDVGICGGKGVESGSGRGPCVEKNAGDVL